MCLTHMDGVIARVLQELREGEGVGEGHLQVIGVPAGRVQRRLIKLPVRPRPPRRLADALGLGARRLKAVGRPTGRVESLAMRTETALLVHAQRPVRHTVPGGVHPAHQRAPRGGTHRAGVGIGEEHPLLGQPLHVGRARGVTLVQTRAHRLAILIIEGHRRVLPPHVVDHEEDDVRTLAALALRPLRGLRRRRPGSHRPHARAQHTKKRSARNHTQSFRSLQYAPFPSPAQGIFPRRRHAKPPAHTVFHTQYTFSCQRSIGSEGVANRSTHPCRRPVIHPL